MQGRILTLPSEIIAEAKAKQAAAEEQARTL